MKVEMSEYGRLKLFAETTTEMYALNQWLQKSYINQEDMQRNEIGYFRGSCIEVGKVY